MTTGAQHSSTMSTRHSRSILVLFGFVLARFIAVGIGQILLAVAGYHSEAVVLTVPQVVNILI